MKLNSKAKKLIAGTLSVALVATSITFFNNSKQVQAKETFQGIMEIAEANSEDSPFEIFEIVPGYAECKIGSGEYETTVKIPLGTLGYYIGGSEPSNFAETLSALKTSELRQEYVDLFLKDNGGALEGILAPIAAKDDSAPLTYTGYEETYDFLMEDGDLTRAEEEDNPWTEVLPTEDGENIITKLAACPSENGIFLKKYAPSENAITSLDDIAADKDLDKTTGKDGDFDPHFIHHADNSGAYSVIFEPNTAKRGFVVTEAVQVYGDDTSILDDTPIYTPSENGVFVYAGKFSAIKAGIPHHDAGSDDEDIEVEETAEEEVKKSEGSDEEYEVVEEEIVEEIEVPAETIEVEEETKEESVIEEENASGDEEVEVLGDDARAGTGYYFELPHFAAEGEAEVIEISEEEMEAAIEESSDEITVEEVDLSDDIEYEENIIYDGYDDSNEDTEEEVAVDTEEVIISDNAGIEGNLGSFYMLVLSYDSGNGGNETCYSVTDYEKITTSSVLYDVDSEELFVPNYSNTGCIKDTNKTPRAFLYEKTDIGNYNLIEGTSDPGIRVSEIKVYYRGPFKNNEWFKKYVFDRDYSEATGKLKQEFSIHYSCFTPDEFASYEPSGAGLLYVANPDNTFIPAGATVVGGYGTDADKLDITNGTLKGILAAVADDDLPVMIDGSFIRGENNTDGTNLQLLARLLQQKDVVAMFANHSEKSESEFVEAVKNFDDWFNNDINSHHVNQSIYVINGSVGVALNSSFKTKFDNNETAAGFVEIIDEIETENEYRKANNKKEFISEDVSEAVAIKYIIAYGSRKGAYVKESVHILELQPCIVPQKDDKKTTGNLIVEEKEKNDVTYYSLSVKNEKGDNQVILSDMESPIYVTSMSTSEFVGREEDISSEYDLVYIGLATTYINTDSNGKPVYNDTAMNGLYYTNTGDYVKLDKAMSGLLPRDFSGGSIAASYDKNNKAGLARYSGNDISAIKVKKLKEYVKAGYPVLCAHDIFGDNANLDYDVIDKNSYVGKFLESIESGIADGNKNVFSLPAITSPLNMKMKSKLEWYLNLPKPELELDESYAKKGAAQDVYFENEKYYMEYMFSISDKAATDSDGTYDCELYIDINSDGRFAGNEKRDEFVILTAGGTRQGKEKGKYHLKAGKDYYAYFVVTDEYDGPLPWKLQITSNDYEGRRDSEIGCYRIHRIGADKLRVNILQILPDDKLTGEWNLSDTSDQMTREFIKLAQSLNHYNVSITTMRNREFVDALAKARDDGDDFWSQWDLLVLGFAPGESLEHGYEILEDCNYGGDYTENATFAAKSLVSYIESGRSVLVSSGVVTSDITDGTIVRDSGGGVRQGWGYNTTRRLRTLIGQDRYGVVASEETKSEHPDYFITPTDPGRDSKSPEIQGFTNIVQDKGTFINNQWYHNNNIFDYLSTSKTEGLGDSEPLIRKGSMECINRGQITMYPYELSDQYYLNNVTYKPVYSLNLVEDEDKDGESDVVVWYTYINPWDNGGNRSDYHVNDARDMYFMYTKGNITFINMCRNAYSGDLTYLKLIVNTMIAAFEAGNHAPKVRIVDEPDVDGHDLEAMYVLPTEYGVDTAWWSDEADSRSNPKINFYVSGAPKNATIEMRVYCDTKDDYSGWGGAKIEIDKINWSVKQLLYGNTDHPDDPNERTRWGLTAIYNPLTKENITEDLFRCDADGGYKEWYEIKQNTVYQVEIPIRIMDDEETRRIFIEATAIMKNPDGTETKKDVEIKSASGYDSVTLIRPQLFNLD